MNFADRLRNMGTLDWMGVAGFLYKVLIFVVVAGSAFVSGALWGALSQEKAMLGGGGPAAGYQCFTFQKGPPLQPYHDPLVQQ